MIMYTLRNITLGAISFFGLAIGEIIMLEKKYAVVLGKVHLFETVFHDANKEAELKMKEAELNAEKILNDAEIEAKEVLMKKERIQKELKDFIQIEKELIRKYENL
ncbi:MAG: DivIVA domain-containing protein [Bacteroidetes bacterium]|nr:DivIVA domain-containing protein [Bacteroidota bacterium]